jgi:WD40 repeat protein
MPAPPAGVDGTLYGPFGFGATGGFMPLSFATTAGSLPPGLSLGTDGSLTGTPTRVGTSDFEVTVTDSAPVPAMITLPFSINIAAPPPPVITRIEPPAGTVGSPYEPLQFTANGGLAPLVWSETPPLDNGLSISSDGILSGTPSAAGEFKIALEVTDALKQAAPPVAVVVRISLVHPGSFSVLPDHLQIPRSGHTATLLHTGKVLIAGGGNGAADTSAELYDPAAGTFTMTTGIMTEARIGHTATLLDDPALPNYGRVLIVGSAGTSAELYDPATGEFTATGSMHHARTSPTATVLGNTGANAGKVLVVGGNSSPGDLVAELYDPSAGTFTDTGSTTLLRAGHTATLLTVGPLAGQVLIAGGSSSKSAELYDPATGRFTRTGDMSEARSGHTATALGLRDGAQNGHVLIIGTDGTADLYDPTAGAFAAVGSYYPNYGVSFFSRTATLRRDGTVLLAGGYVLDGTYKLEYGPPPQTYCVLIGYLPASMSWAALFAPESDGFTATAPLDTSRDGHTATVLPNDAVLIVGGTRHTLVSPASPRAALTTGGTHRAVVPGVSPEYSHPCATSTESATVLSSAELFK